MIHRNTHFSLHAALIIITAIAISNSSPVGAQGWWSKVKEAINSDSGKTVLETLGTEKSLASGLSNTEIIAGLREALNIGTQKVVGQLGASNGFNLDPKIHIPLPSTLAKVDNALSAIGMNSLTDELELKLNRAAEAATPKAKELFINAISQMSITDAKNILTGPQDAATSFLRTTMGPELTESMQPIVSQAMASAGAVKAYDSVMGQYGRIPFMPNVKANLNDYVVNKAMDGIFYYIAQEEAAIRANPVARTTDLLKKVFRTR